MTAAGYSGTPLSRKLGIAAGSRVLALHAPPGYRALVAPLPEGVRFVRAADPRVDLAHLFVTERAVLARALQDLRADLRPDAVLWVSWPKRAARVTTDVTEDVVRAEALPLGWVDVKVCAVDSTWSGLKLMVRRSER